MLGATTMLQDARRRLNSARAIVVAFQAVPTVVAVVALTALWGDESDPAVVAWTASLLFTAHACWAFWSWWAVTGRLVDAYTAFLLALLLFSGGHMLLWVAQALPDGMLGGQFSAATMQRTLLIVNAAICAFHLGGLARAARSSVGVRARQAVPNTARLRRIGLVFLAVAVPAVLVATYEGVMVVAREGYIGLYQRGLRVGFANWTGLLSMLLTPGLLISLGTAPRRPRNVRLVWLLAGASMASSIFLGYRNTAVLLLVPMLMLHHRTVRPLSRRLLVLVTVIAVVLLPWIAAIRGLSLEERIATARGDTNEELSVIPGVALLREMGTTMATVAHTINLVPHMREYEYGLGYLLAASTALPNVFGDRHIAYARGTYGHWLTREVNPWVAERGGSLGYSMIAEAFINFGPAGTVAVCAALGFLLAAFVARCREHGDSHGLVFECVVLSVILFYARGESANAVRALIWCAALPYWLSRARMRGPAMRWRRVPQR